MKSRKVKLYGSRRKRQNDVIGIMEWSNYQTITCEFDKTLRLGDPWGSLSSLWARWPFKKKKIENKAHEKFIYKE